MSSRPNCIFEIHQLWQSGISRVYSNCWCSSSFESEIMKIVQSSHKVYSNNLLNFQVSTTILKACTKNSVNLLNAPLIYKERVSERKRERWTPWLELTPWIRLIALLGCICITFWKGMHRNVFPPAWTK